jgi:hypothetical protein
MRVGLHEPWFPVWTYFNLGRVAEVCQAEDGWGELQVHDVRPDIGPFKVSRANILRGVIRDEVKIAAIHRDRNRLK